MANLHEYAVSRSGLVNYVFTARVEEIDQITGQPTVIADFTGSNALAFPQVLTTMTPEQRDAFAAYVSLWIIQVKAGLSE